MPNLFGDIMGYINAGRAGKTLSDGYQNAMNAILQATGDGQRAVSAAAGQGQQGVTTALGDANTRMTEAGNKATAGMTQATGEANAGLQGNLTSILNSLQPYTQAGQQGLAQLSEFTKNTPQFSFNYDDYKNDPAYKFQLESGTRAIGNSMGAQGLGQSGTALKELSKFGEGLAATHYEDAYNRALKSFQADQASRQQQLQGIGSLLQAGEFGSQVGAGAQQNIGSQMAQNTINGATYNGNAGMSISQLLSQLGVQGAEYSGDLGLRGQQLSGTMGMQGAQQAGEHAIGMSQARAGGIMGQGKNMASGVGDLASLLMMFI